MLKLIQCAKMADKAAVEDSAAVLIAMSEGKMNGAPTKRSKRIIKKNSRYVSDDDEVPRSPKKSNKPLAIRMKFTQPHSRSTHDIAQSNNTRLKNILKLPKAHKFVLYEWFYSTLDDALLNGENDFQAMMKENFPDLVGQPMRRAEWCKIRRLMGKPRRCSSAFFEEERRMLEQRRDKVRLIQQQKLTDFSDSDLKELPQDIPLPLVIGTEVTGLLRPPNAQQEGLYIGKVIAVDTINHTYRVTFERPSVSCSVPDFEVRSNLLQDTLPISSFQARNRTFISRYHAMSSIATPPRPVGSQSAMLGNDPLLGFSPIQQRILGDQTGVLGGFPVSFLVEITKLSKTLKIKHEKIIEFKQMNTEAERQHSYQEPVTLEFQRRYACSILELSDLNKHLEDQLNTIEQYTSQLVADKGLGGMDTSSATKVNSELQAKEMVEASCNDLKYNIQNKDMSNTIQKLASLLLQLKSISESEINSFDLKTLQQSMEELRVQTDSSNSGCYRNNVEVHVNHIQGCLTQMGNLHAFSSSHPFF